jgi:hypothetical protein
MAALVAAIFASSKALRKRNYYWIYLIKCRAHRGVSFFCALRLAFSVENNLVKISCLEFLEKMAQLEKCQNGAVSS